VSEIHLQDTVLYGDVLRLSEHGECLACLTAETVNH